MLPNAFFVFAKQIISWHLIFYFGINTVLAIPKIELANNFLHKGIKLNFQAWIEKIWLIQEFFFVPDGKEDTWLTVWTRCRHTNERKCTKYCQPSNYCHGILGLSPFQRHVWNTCPGHFQLLYILQRGLQIIISWKTARDKLSLKNKIDRNLLVQCNSPFTKFISFVVIKMTLHITQINFHVMCWWKVQ